MKKTRIILAHTGKIILGLFIFLFIFGAIGSLISKSKSNSFEGQIEHADKQCPVAIAGGAARIASIKGENNMVVYYLDYDSKKINFDLLKQNIDIIKRLMVLSSFALNAQGPGNGDKFLEELIKHNYGLAFHISSNDSDTPGSSVGNVSQNMPIRSSFSVVELRKVQESVKLNPTEAISEILKLQVKMEGLSLPSTIDEGMILTSIEIQNNNIVNTILIDEDLYSIESFRENSSEVKHELLQGLTSSPESNALLDLCKIAHTGIIYRLKGTSSGESCDIAITTKDLSRTGLGLINLDKS